MVSLVPSLRDDTQILWAVIRRVFVLVVYEFAFPKPSTDLPFGYESVLVDATTARVRVLRAPHQAIAVGALDDRCSRRCPHAAVSE